MVIGSTREVVSGAGTLNVRRLALSGIFALLLLGQSPVYEYRGGPEDEATLNARYGPPDGGVVAYGPDLYALPEGWILAGTCLLLAVSAMPFAPARLRRLPCGRLCMAAGLLMLISALQADPVAWLHDDFGVGGDFGSPEVGRYAYELHAVIVLAVGAALALLSRRRSP